MFWSKIALIAAATALIGGLCFLAAGGIFCSATLHVPKSVSTAPSNTTTVELLAKDRARLSAWWLHPLHPNGNCVMALHGISDSRVSSVGFAPMFLEKGYAFLAPDSRAHGASGGALVTYGLLERYDTIAWAHWMRDQDCNKVYGLGESLGAAVLIQAAAVKPAFAAIVAESPYADLREIAEYRLRGMTRLPPRPGNSLRQARSQRWNTVRQLSRRSGSSRRIAGQEHRADFDTHPADSWTQ